MREAGAWLYLAADSLICWGTEKHICLFVYLPLIPFEGKILAMSRIYIDMNHMKKGQYIAVSSYVLALIHRVLIWET